MLILSTTHFRLASFQKEGKFKLHIYRLYLKELGTEEMSGL